MTKKELAEKIADFNFPDMESAYEIVLKAADAFGFKKSAKKKGDEALGRNPSAYKDTKKGLTFEPDFLKSLDAETLYGMALYLYDFDDVLQPFKHYKKAFKAIMTELANKVSGDEKIDGYRKRRDSRRDSTPVGRWRKRRSARLDARWITIGATPEDKEAGIPAGKGRHVLIDDEGVIVSGAGGSLTGVKLTGAKSTSEEVKVDPTKVSTAAEGSGTPTGAVSTGEGKVTEGGAKAVSGPSGSVTAGTEGGEEPKEKTEEKTKLRIASSGEEFAQALGEAKTKEERQAILDKMPALTTMKLGDETYRKKTNGEWTIEGHKAPKDVAGFEDADWGAASVETAIEKFRNAVMTNSPAALERLLKNYAVGTVIKFRKENDMALERKKSGWIVTAGGEYYELSMPTGKEYDEDNLFKDVKTWNELAKTADNWYVKRKKDGDVATKEPSKELQKEFDEEAGNDDKDFYDLVKKCDVGTTIDIAGDTYKRINKDFWELDTEGKEYAVLDDGNLADRLNAGGTFYLGSHKVAKPVDMTAARKVAKADWEQYTTPEYLKTVPSWKNYPAKSEKVRETKFKNFSDEELAEANAILEKLFEQAEFCARFDSHKIDSFIENGLLNQFESGTSHGYHDGGHGIRYQASQKLFGTQLKKDGEYVDGKDFEKYGFMTSYDEIKSGGDAYWYGDGCLIFDKDAVQDRATYTHGDSLAGGFTPGTVGHPPTIFGLKNVYGEMSTSEKDSLMNKLRKMKTWEDLRDSGLIGSYVEMQYHGKMPISTVKEIILKPGTKISAAGQAKLDEYGIKITYKNI